MKATISVAACLRNQGAAVPYKDAANMLWGVRESVVRPECVNCADGRRAKAGKTGDKDVQRIIAQERKKRMDETKECRICKEPKPLSEFGYGKNSTMCRACTREYKRHWEYRRYHKAKTEVTMKAMNEAVPANEVMKEAPPEAVNGPIAIIPAITANHEAVTESGEVPQYDHYFLIDLKRFPEVIAWLRELSDREDRTPEAQVRNILRSMHRAHVACSQ